MSKEKKHKKKVSVKSSETDTPVVVDELQQDVTDSNHDEMDVELDKKFADLEAKVDENWNKFLQASAELDNVRKRAERDLANAHKYAVEKCIKALIPVIDSLEQGLEAGDKNNADVRSFHEGMELTHKLLLEALSKFGLQQLDPQGEPFNPHYHEAVSTQPDDNVEPNTVINVFQRGYTLHDRVVRPAMVVVAK